MFARAKVGKFLAILTLVLMVAPTASAQAAEASGSTPTSLYFHIFDPFAKFVVNTQPYNATFFDVGGVVFPANPVNGWDFNTIYGYSTAGPVEYDFIEGGKPRFHPERGIAADVEIDPAVTPTIYLYVDARSLFGGYETPIVQLPMTFRAQVRTGDDLGSDFNTGQLILDGTYTAHLTSFRQCPAHLFNVATLGTTYFTECFTGHVDPVNGQYLGEEGPGTGTDQFPAAAPDGTPILYPDANNVIEIAIPLDVELDKIPKDEAYNIRLDWYQELYGAAGEDEWQVNNLRLVLSEEYLPRMELAVKNPVYVEFVHPQVAAGTLLIHTGVNSPWGTYDVDVDNIELTIDGPVQPRSIQQVVSQNSHVHGLHDKAAEITYLWEFRDEAAPSGEYTINLKVPNLAGTAVATSQAKFTIEGKKAFGTSDTGEIVEPAVLDEAADTPGFGILALLAPLGVALAIRRWRQ